MGDVVLRVRRRLLIAAGGPAALSDNVYCPARGHSVNIDTCKKCVHAHAVSSEHVVCAPPGPRPQRGLGAPAGLAARPNVTLIRADIPVLAVRIVSQKAEARDLPVVDKDCRFLGFVSPRMLQRPQWPWNHLSQARELVAARSLFVFEDHPLAQALRTMAYRGARALALLDPSGILQGVLSDIDALKEVIRARAAQEVRPPARW